MAEWFNKSKTVRKLCMLNLGGHQVWVTGDVIIRHTLSLHPLLPLPLPPFFFFFKLSLNSFSLSMSATINTHQPHYCYPGLENWVAPSQQPVFKSLPSSMKHECHKKLTRKSRSPHRNTWRWTRSREESNL